MVHLLGHLADAKPVENVQPGNLPPDAQNPDVAATALDALVNKSMDEPDVKHTVHAPMHLLDRLPGVHALVPGLERLATQYHVGNYVLVRASGERIFESMPVYPRLGMHLLYYGGTQIKLLHNKSVERVLKELSERDAQQGEVYDTPASVKSIPSFIETYSIGLDELLEPDITKYKCFNDFFYRKLRPDARPVQNSDDLSGFCSAADCRLTVYESVDLAHKFWIKGNKFTIAALIGSEEKAKQFEGGSVAVFRLAPQDYHRFHSPLDGVVGDITDIPGQYYTVNPQAVNESGFDVFTENKRSVLYLTHAHSGAPVAFVSIGAMLVGSIQWTGGRKAGESVLRGEELGYYAYGGSTNVAVFPKGVIEFDEDLVRNSQVPIETLVKVGDSLGRCIAPARAV